MADGHFGVQSETGPIEPWMPCRGAYSALAYRNRGDGRRRAAFWRSLGFPRAGRRRPAWRQSY